MKVICVSMNIKEQVLDSYLLRVFNGELNEKNSLKTVRFPLENIESNPSWDIPKFKNFCEAVATDKKSLEMYKARLIPQKGGQHVK